MSDNSYDSDERRQEYTLKKLKEFMALKNFYVTRQFVLENNIVFLKVYVETIGDYILVYFPSKYSVPKESSNIPVTDITSYELSSSDILAYYTGENDDESYSEVDFSEGKDLNGFANESYKSIDMDGMKDSILRKKAIKYTNQMNKFKNCTAKIKYKFGILTNEIMCVINRHNETECYQVLNGQGLVSNIVDSKTDELHSIQHELYVLIDLPSFYEKINTVPEEIIKLYKHFYAILAKSHTKQTSLAEHRFKNYQNLVGKMVQMYNKNNKFLDMLDGLTSSLNKSIAQEEQIKQKINVIESQKDQPSQIAKDTENSFKLSKNEQELQKVKGLKHKTMKLLHEIKSQYQNFLLSYDSAISEIAKDLGTIEVNMYSLGISLDKKK